MQLDRRTASRLAHPASKKKGGDGLSAVEKGQAPISVRGPLEGGVV